MAETHEWMFYEVMWRNEARGRTMPVPWWVQQYFRKWMEPYDGGLFASKEAAFASNALYRYWNMIGVKEHTQESLIGQAGEVEPVYDQYSLSFFLFDPDARELHLPQFPDPDGATPSLEQRCEEGSLPVLITTFRSRMGIVVEEKALATTVGAAQRSVVLVRLKARLSGATPARAWLCVSVSPAGPTGFERHDRARKTIHDRRLSFLHYAEQERSLLVNAGRGPVFDRDPAHFGTYGNGGSMDPDFYLDNNPYQDLVQHGGLNGWETAQDHVAGLCTAVFAWPMELQNAADRFALDVRLPVDDFRDPADLAALRTHDPDELEEGNRAFWTGKLDGSGLQATLPPRVGHLVDLHRTCRANLLILADHGQIHPGPTIYDSFWVRDSSVEGVACALTGDQNLAERQFGDHYPTVFQRGYERVGPVSLHGFFGGEHERNDREWDSNGQALWAIGRFDRIRNGGSSFGAGMFSPYVIEGARWIRDNRSEYGLLHSGWSAEHIGDKGKPHYWDDFWALAGLWEAARLAERIGAPEAGEIWGAYDDLRRAVIDSIRWVLTAQRQQGNWETYIPTGPGDVGRLDSTLIGAVAYVHPCRLYMGSKLGDDIDLAVRMTLDTVWGHFMDGGFRHDAAWNSYGPYLTLQLAHAFLLLGDVERMDHCLGWCVYAAHARVSRGGNGGGSWQVVSGAWNEQHCYPTAKDFAEVPDRWWYMGDIPHGWACAEYLMLLRDILFFEAGEDGPEPHIYIAPGVMPHWLEDGERVAVSGAPTIFGVPFGYRLEIDRSSRTVEIEILEPAPSHVHYVYPCRFGRGVDSARANGQPVPVSGREVRLPPGTTRARVRYLV